MPNFAEALTPPAPLEDPRADKYERRLREQLEAWNAELAEVEDKIEAINSEVEKLQSIRKGLAASQAVFATLSDSGDAVEKMAAADEAVQALIVARPLNELLAEQRRLKLLIAGAAVDAAGRSSKELE